MHGGAGLAGAYRPGVEDRELRQLALAMLASLVLHALILQLLPVLREAKSARATPPITAHLAKPKPPPELPRVEPLPPPVPRAVAKPQPRPAPVPAPILSVEPKPTAEGPSLIVPPASSQPATPPPVAKVEVQSSAPAASGPDPGAVARFRLELMETAKRYKRYPRIAQDNNWEGRVELHISFSGSGAMTVLAVKKGSGRTILDEQGLSMIRAAQPEVSIPPALRGKAFTLEVAIDFLLKEER